ncbi:MAG: MurR/RpiR family transcriptional regulator [Christensenellaceae bacterium]|nr:MurR/RpiR family transcriptional regulator [Christensenellaceae bacterium]
MPARMKLSSIYTTLPPAERRVADFILSDPDAASRMVITDIATGAGVSLPSVTRLAKKLGYDGFMDFRVALASSRSVIHSIIDEPISINDSDQVFIHKLMVGQMRAVESTLRVLNKEMLCELADKMIASNRIVWFGVGNSLSIVTGINDYLVRIGIDSMIMHEASFMRTYAKHLGIGDLFFGVSRTGVTKRTLDCLRIAKEHGAATAFMTNFTNSPAEDLADFFICTSRMDELYRLCGIETNSAQKALLEVLSALIAKKIGHICEEGFIELLTSMD